MRDPPTGQRSFVRRFGRYLLQSEQGVDTKRVEWIEHQQRHPDIGQILNCAPTRSEKRYKVQPEKQNQPDAHTNNQTLRAVVREIASCKTARKKSGGQQKRLEIKGRQRANRGRGKKPRH